MEPRDHFDERQTADAGPDEWPWAGEAPPLEPRFEALRAAYPHLPVAEFAPAPARYPEPPMDPAFARHFAEPHRRAVKVACIADRRATTPLPQRLLATTAALLRLVGEHVRKAPPKGTVIVTLAFSSLALIGYAVTAQRLAPEMSTAPTRQAEALLMTFTPDCPSGARAPGCPTVVAMPARRATPPVERLGLPAPSPGPSGFAISGSTTSPALHEAPGIAVESGPAVHPTHVPPHAAVAAAASAPGEALRPERSVVSELQTRLTALGYAPGKVDGRLGRRTIRAVKAFQRDHAAPPDGVLSSALLATIRAAQPMAQEMRTAAGPGARG